MRIRETFGARLRDDDRGDVPGWVLISLMTAGLVIATPKGRISRYLYGVEYPPRDLRLGLMEASAGKIGSPIDRLLLLCYHYDPSTGKYNLVIMNVLQVLGAATVVGLGTFMFVMFRRDRRKAVATGGA